MPAPVAGSLDEDAIRRMFVLDRGDVELALQTASAIDDDRLQKQAQGYVVPDAFTHGSSQQRTLWFTTGLKSGALSSCDTFATTQQSPSARNMQ